MVVDNRPGGNGTIGTAAVVKSAPDGYTWVIATVGDFTISQHVIKNIPYDPLTDLVPVMSLTDTPCVLAVNAASPYKTLADVLADAKKQPGKLSYATPGVGAINQLLMEWMASSDRHVVHPRSLQGRRAGRCGGCGRRRADRAAGGVLGDAASEERQGAHDRQHRGNALADHRRTCRRMREGGVRGVDGTNYTLMLGAQGHAGGDHRQAQRRDHQDPEHRPTSRRSWRRVRRSPIPSTPAELAARLKRESAAFKVIVEKAKITAE